MEALSKQTPGPAESPSHLTDSLVVSGCTLFVCLFPGLIALVGQGEAVSHGTHAHCSVRGGDLLRTQTGGYRRLF